MKNNILVPKRLSAIKCRFSLGALAGNGHSNLKPVPADPRQHIIGTTQNAGITVYELTGGLDDLTDTKKRGPNAAARLAVQSALDKNGLSWKQCCEATGVAYHLSGLHSMRAKVRKLAGQPRALLTQVEAIVYGGKALTSPGSKATRETSKSPAQTCQPTLMEMHQYLMWHEGQPVESIAASVGKTSDQINAALVAVAEWVRAYGSQVTVELPR